jgi:hypothetical protein
MGNLASALQELRAERKQAQVASREVGSGDFGNRVIKRFWNSPAGKPTDPNNIAGFTPQDGTGAKSKMGKGSR